MSGDKSYIYGDHNGAEYVDSPPNDDRDQAHTTHWDPRLSIEVVAGTVQVGIVRPKTDEDGRQVQPPIWDNEDGQFISLSRDGLNRLIVAARECRDSAYGRDQ